MGCGSGAAALQSGVFGIGKGSSESVLRPGSPDTHSFLGTHPSGTSRKLGAFPEKEYIDLARTARILGTTDSTVMVLFSRGLIDIIDYAFRKRKRVRYQSVVDFCNVLRARHAIKDRRPPLENPRLRHRDEDVLPFPLVDTLSCEQTTEILGYSSVTPVRRMIEEGRFEAYQFYASSPWRVSRLSLRDYIASVLPRSGASPRKKGGVWA